MADAQFVPGREPTPFTTREAWVVEGAWLDKPWVPDTKIIGNDPFVKISPEDRQLARALGKDMSGRMPWGDKNIFFHLEAMRDDRVDELIHEAAIAADPMADRTGVKK